MVDAPDVYMPPVPDSPLARAIVGYIDTAPVDSVSEFSELEEQWFAEGDQLETMVPDELF